MRRNSVDLSWILVGALLAMGLVFLFAPPVQGARGSAAKATPRVPQFVAPSATIRSLPEALDPLLPAVSLRRVWSGFEVIPGDDQATPLHFEVLADGRLGWGPTWRGQLRVAPRGDLLKVGLAQGRSPADLRSLRDILSRAGMMAPDASLGDQR